MAPGDADDEHEDVPYRTPLPKDDRLWRHPSEIDDSPKRLAWWPFRRHNADDSAASSN